MHRKYMGLRSQVQTTRERARGLDAALAQRDADLGRLREMLTAYKSAFAVIADAQEEKRLNAGVESADEILRLASGVGPDDFARWQADLEALLTGQTGT